MSRHAPVAALALASAMAPAALGAEPEKIPPPWSAEWVMPFDPVMVDGKVWTFQTPPPPKNQRKVTESHPRILLRKADLPALRTKLRNPIFKDCR